MSVVLRVRTPTLGELAWPEEDSSKKTHHKNRGWVDILTFAKVGEVQMSPGLLVSQLLLQDANPNLLCLLTSTEHPVTRMPKPDPQILPHKGSEPPSQSPNPANATY